MRTWENTRCRPTIVICSTGVPTLPDMRGMLATLERGIAKLGPPPGVVELIGERAESGHRIVDFT